MAGTINTTNYNFKKYAPDDTVSMLQTFNGNMDAIDKAIKDRADVETEQGASITKLETGLANANDGINSANQTISAVQVQVTTNTRNIQNANTEIDTLDTRVQALEDGGSAIERINPTNATTASPYYIGFYKQGNHYFGTAYSILPTILSENTVSVNSVDNYALSRTATCVKIYSLTGNVFGLNPNIGHVVGLCNTLVQDPATSNYGASLLPLFALFDGNTTYFVAESNLTSATSFFSITLDTVI